MRPLFAARRSRLRVHLSTLIGASLICASLVLINIPGYRTGLGRQHGWPLSYLRREEPEPAYRPGIRCRAYRVPDIWSLSADVAKFRLAHLLLNVVAVLTLTLVAGAAIELYRR